MSTSKTKEQATKCKLHQQLIQQLLNENTLIKEKYQNLVKQHEKLREKYQRLSHKVQKSSEASSDIGTKIEDIVASSQNNKNQQGFLQNNRFSQKFGTSKQSFHIQDMIDETKQGVKKVFSGQVIENKNLLKVSSNQSQRLPNQISRLRQRSSSRSSRVSRNSSLAQKFFPLIEGCFIIQKKKSYQQKHKNCLGQMLQFIYPQQLAKTQRQTIQMMLRYTFTEPQIRKIEDDQFNSRRNQVVYGTPYQDYSFAFQDNKWISKKQLPQILKLMGTMKKKYYHILIKPQIIQKSQFQQVKQQNKTSDSIKEQPKKEQSKQEKQEKKQKQKQNKTESSDYFYQTEVIFGFISAFPLRLFFQDLHRTIQQELKYSQFTMNEQNQQIYNPTMKRKDKYKIMGQIMKKLYDYEYKINKFPIDFTYTTGITKISINIPSVMVYRQIQDQFLNQALVKYSGTKIIKLLHYVLAEKCVLVQCSDPRTLNQLFQIIRILIRPFLWIFAVVYVYSDYFQPFMSSPMPILIGKVQQIEDEHQSEENAKKKKKIKRQSSMDYSDFCVIKMDQQQIEFKQNQPYYKTMKKLKKQWQKSQKDKKQDKVTLIHKYVNSLKTFIQKGILNSEPTDFHIQFIDTQMVSYFKDTKEIL